MSEMLDEINIDIDHESSLCYIELSFNFWM